MDQLKIDINDISETALLMVILHAQDALSDSPILDDKSSIKTLQAIQSADLSVSQPFKKIIEKGKLERVLATYINLRAKYYDDAVREWLSRYPTATIVNIGCGLDDRFSRVDNGKMKMLEIDFPDIINIKKDLFPPSDRCIYMAQSVFDTSWIKQIDSQPTLLLAEGVFMYCEEEDVRFLFNEIASRLPGSELLCEMYAKKYLKPWIKEISYQMQRLRYGLGRDATFSFGAQNSQELANWNESITHVSDWTFLECNHPKIGALKLLRHIPWMSKNFWTSRFEFRSS